MANTKYPLQANSAPTAARSPAPLHSGVPDDWVMTTITPAMATSAAAISRRPDPLAEHLRGEAGDHQRLQGADRRGVDDVGELDGREEQDHVDG